MNVSSTSTCNKKGITQFTLLFGGQKHAKLFKMESDRLNDTLPTKVRTQLQLNDFCSKFGAEHYGLEPNPSKRKITLEKVSWKVPQSYDLGELGSVTPLRAGKEIAWRIVE